MSYSYSYVGNQEYVNTYATPINIYCSPLTIAELRENSKYLPTNALIISSPQTIYNYDNGKPAIIITDGIGNILPLTYTLVLNNIKYDETENTIINK
jgi:hypothetical protein